MSVYRGQIVRADVGLEEPKRFLVVSNNKRNGSRLGSVLAVRLTSSAKHEMETIVVLPSHEYGDGGSRVLCDDIEPIYYKEIIGNPLGALSPRTMAQVDLALRAALALE